MQCASHVRIWRIVNASRLHSCMYSSAPSITDAETIFGTAGTSVTIPTDQYSTAPTAEGFNTVTLDGPGALGTVGNQNMILILKSGISYTYFNIDVTTITQ